MPHLEDSEEQVSVPISTHVAISVSVWVWTGKGNVKIGFRVRTEVKCGMQGACRRAGEGTEARLWGQGGEWGVKQVS